jgi:uncharacterized protein
MALSKKYLVIKLSGIKGAGKGLFTKKFIEKGTKIVEYKGRKTTWKEVQQQPGFNGYVYYINRNLVIDAKNYLKTFGRFANDAKGINKEISLKNNSRYVVDKEKVFIEAIKDIPAGSEIFVSYGKEYWDVIHYNKKLGL